MKTVNELEEDLADAKANLEEQNECGDLEDRRGAAALSKHLALPCAKCLRSRGAFLAPTALRLGNATMALRWVPTQLSGALRQRFAVPGSSLETAFRIEEIEYALTKARLEAAGQQRLVP